MTPDQQKEAERQATAKALLIGGLTAMLFARRGPGRNVEFINGRFLIDGRVVSIATIRQQLLRIEDRFAAVMAEYARRLETGRWNVERWRNEMFWLIASSHILSAALAVGSIHDAAQDPIVNRRIDSESVYLSSFADQVRERTPRPRDKANTTGPDGSGMGKAAIAAAIGLFGSMSFAQLASRAKGYLLAASATYSVVEHQIRIATGMTEARRIRRRAESCPGCVEWARRGWVPIAQMPPIGSLQCRSRCRCYLIYR